MMDGGRPDRSEANAFIAIPAATLMHTWPRPESQIMSLRRQKEISHYATFRLAPTAKSRTHNTDWLTS